MLNSRSPVPLYHQLADILLAKIRSGEYPPGTRIPSENSLASSYGIGRPTARQATDLLVRKRILARRRGAGTFVQAEPKDVDLFSLAGTMCSFHKQGITPNFRILHKTRLQKINGDPENPFNGRNAYYMSRLSLVEDTPVLVEDIYLHEDLFSGIDAIDLSGQSLSRIVDEQYYMRPEGGRQNFRIGYLTGKRAKHLAVSAETPVLIVHRVLDFAQKEDAVYAELFCRTDRFVFSQAIGGPAYD